MALTTVPVELANLDGAVTVNESSADADFRVESNGYTHMLFVDGGANTVNIGGSTDQGGLLNLEGYDADMLVLHRTADTGDQSILFKDHGDHNATISGKNGGALALATNGNTTAVTIDSNQKVGIGTTTPGSYNANADDLVIFDDNVHAGITIAGGTDDYGNIYFAQGTSGSNAYRGYIQYGHSATTDANYRDVMVFGTATLERLKIHGDGSVTMPAQPAFQAASSANQENIAVGGTDVTVIFASVRFDQNSDYNNSTYTFTAPVTGKYWLGVTLRIDSMDQAASYYRLQIVTSNRTYYPLIKAGSTLGTSDPTYSYMQGFVLADMDAADTALIKISQVGGTSQMDIIQTESQFQGYLVA